MIDAKELRIGNWVKNIELHHQNPYQVDGYHIYALENGKIDFNPIPLTPEILERCGFENNDKTTSDSWIFEKCRVWFNQIKDSETLKYFFFDQTLRVEVKYLHQLQNLYFALTGEELQYTP